MNEPNREEMLFASALELPSHQRIPYLDEACVGDVELRRRVEDLLWLHEGAGGFMEIPAAAAASGAVTGTSRVLPVSEKPGDRIGRYPQSAAANRRPAGQSDGSGNLSATVAASRAFPAAVADLLGCLTL